MYTVSVSSSRWLFPGAVILLIGVLLSAGGRSAQAVPSIPEGGSMGIRTFDAGGQTGGVDVLITYAAGSYPMDPIWITTEFPGVVWVGVNVGTYSLLAHDDQGAPIPSTEVLVPVPSGAHDILVPIFLLPTCDADINGDGMVNVLDLIDVLLCFGQPDTAPCDSGQDINADGTIDVLDLIELLLEFGQSCPS